LARFNASQQRTFRDLKAICHSGLTSIALRQALAKALDRLLGLDAFCLMELDPEIALPIHGVTRGWSDEAHDLLLDRVLLVSPVADIGRMHHAGERTVRPEQVARSDPADPYFRYHLLPYGYRHELLTMCRAGGQPLALLTLTRAASRAAFEPWHIRLLDALSPHVGAGMRAALDRDADLAGRAAGACIGRIELDADNRVIAADAGGEAWLRLSRSGSADWHMAIGALRAHGDRLPELVVRHQETGILHRLRVGTTGNNGRCIHIAPLARAEEPGVLRRIGLSAAEAKVAATLLQGRSTLDAARLAGCSPATVRVHLHRIYDKLGIGSRRELAIACMAEAAPHADFTDADAALATPAFIDAGPQLVE
jgi:DNA-binding CsgD family transcriptional regulator